MLTNACWVDSRLSRSTTGCAAVALFKEDGVRVGQRVFLVTGAGGALGLETCAALHGGGASVIAVCRSAERAREAVARILERGGGAPETLAGESADLASLDSVRALARRVRDGSALPGGGPARLHCVVHCAGVLAGPRFSASQDGVETQFAVNFLAGKLLVDLLLPVLRESASRDQPSRVVYVTCDAHRQLRRKWEAQTLPASRATYSARDEYRASKLCQILHAQELNAAARLQPSADRPVRAVAVHPGLVRSALARRAPACSATWWHYSSASLAALMGTPHKSAAAAAGPIVRACLDPGLRGASAPLYLGDDCQPREPSLPGDPAAGRRVLEVADRIIAERAELQLKGASRPTASPEEP
jgi:NAD(P)-dependent dehydrogenase (short-subunit alcohol dehydrogenase family)